MTEQGSQEWLQERLGHVTASRLADVLATVKTGEAASRRNYRAELVAQRLTGTVESGYTNAAVQWGTDNEPIARSEYEVRKSVFVDQVGFIKHPTILWAGASPDGLVGADGLIEIKCPNTATHIDTLLSQTIPSQYEKQMLWQIACTGRAWCDFVSFDPRLPSDLSFFCKRFNPSMEQIKEAEQAVITFLAEVEETLSKLANLPKEQ